MDHTTERIVSFATSLDFRDLTPAVIHAIKQRFIDTIGCALGAFSTEPAVITRRIASNVQSSFSAGSSWHPGQEFRRAGGIRQRGHDPLP